MDTHKFGVKIFLVNDPGQPLAEFIPVFHDWIQRQALPGHLLIDVHDYSHVHHGPGILLVAHEGNFSADAEAGRRGLVYYRKQRVAGDLAAQLRATLATARAAVRLLEADARLHGLQFGMDEFLVIANDRLVAPNEPSTQSALEPVVQQVFGAEFPGRKVTASAAATDPRERFALTVRVN